MVSLWFGASRVVVNCDAVTVTKSVLGWKRTRTIAVADIAQFKTTIGMTAGNTVYRDIKFERRDGKNVVVASSIKDHRDAEWLAVEMTRCAGITPASTL